MEYVFAGENIEVLKMVLDELPDYFDGLEDRILQLETGNENENDKKEKVNEIFKKVHSIKGVSSFSGMVCITKVSHIFENVLNMMRNNSSFICKEAIEFLLSAYDVLNSFFEIFRNEAESKKRAKKIVIEIDTEEKITFLEKQYNDLLALVTKREEMGDTAAKTNMCKAEVEDMTESKQDEKVDEKADEKNDVFPKGVDLLKSDDFKSQMFKEFKEQFVVETIEHIEHIEHELLPLLEKKNDDYEGINNLFRAFHSIKGGTGILTSTMTKDMQLLSTVNTIAIVAHGFESVLSVKRDRKIKFSKEAANLCYEVIDYLKVCIDALINNVAISKPDENLKLKIENMIENIKGNSYNLEKEDSDNNIPKKNDLQQTAKTVTLQSIRVSEEKLDKMMNTIGELIITKNSFFHLSKKIKEEYNLPELTKDIREIGFSINKISDELQNLIMSIRMVEVKTVFQKLNRIVRDISNITNKQIIMATEGESTEIDKNIIEQISDPLIHIIRNAADHGIESPEERRDKGKPEAGNIFLRAYTKDRYVYIEVEDDGKGISPEVVAKKAIEKGIITKEDAEKMSKNQIINLIFMPGFSTAKTVTEISGRGVGMDIVKSNISKVNGKVFVESEVDKGTKMTIQLPLTLSVSRGFLVRASGEEFIIPTENIVETVKIKRREIHTFNNKHFIHLRGSVYGLQSLSSIFGISSSYEDEYWSESFNETDYVEDDDKEINIIIITNGSQKLALSIDKLVNELEFIIKPLHGILSTIKGISGSTILGSGKAVLILNVADIIRDSSAKFSEYSEHMEQVIENRSEQNEVLV